MIGTASARAPASPATAAADTSADIRPETAPNNAAAAILTAVEATGSMEGTRRGGRMLNVPSGCPGAMPGLDFRYAETTLPPRRVATSDRYAGGSNSVFRRARTEVSSRPLLARVIGMSENDSKFYEPAPRFGDIEQWPSSARCEDLVSVRHDSAHDRCS